VVRALEWDQGHAKVPFWSRNHAKGRLGQIQARAAEVKRPALQILRRLQNAGRGYRRVQQLEIAVRHVQLVHVLIVRRVGNQV